MTPQHTEEEVLRLFREDMKRTNYGQRPDSSPPRAALDLTPSANPERARRARELSTIFHWPYKKIAHELGCSETTVFRLLKGPGGTY